MPNPVNKPRRAANLDFIRLIAAMVVLYDHSWPLLYGAEVHSPVTNWLSNNGIFGLNFGRQAVLIFFIISGYLIPKSLDRAPNLSSFISARALRIYPGIIVNVTLTVVLGGLALTTLPLGAYLSDSDTWEFLINNSLLRNLDYELPGVFEALPYAGVVNGSLWSLPYELGAYFLTVLVSLVIAWRGTKRYALYWLLALVMMWIFPQFKIVSTMKVQLWLAYMLGTVWYYYRSDIKECLTWQTSKYRYVGTATVAVVALLSSQGILLPRLYDPAMLYLVTASILWLGFRSPVQLRLPVDISYGVYIYGFPVQQLLVQYQLENLPSGKILCLQSIVCVVPLAVLSWYLVEKPAMGKRQALAEKVSALGNTAKQRLQHRFGKRQLAN